MFASTNIPQSNQYTDDQAKESIVVDAQEETKKPLKVDNRLPIVKKMQEHFPGIKKGRFPVRVLNMDFQNDILPAEEKLINQYGFVKEEINFVMRYRPTFVLFEEKDKQGIHVINKFFVDQKGFDRDTVRTLVVKYPYILGKTEQDFSNYFKLLKDQGLTDDEAMWALLECPKLISMDLDKQMKEIFFLFNLYHCITEKEVMEIFMSFPYLFCCETLKIKKFMNEFRKYKFTKEQIIHLCKNAGGILASKLSNFVGLFDIFRKEYKIKASEVVELLDNFPEFVYQNKKDLIRRKFELIRKHTKKSDTYMRNLFRRHPELFMKSWASMEAKVNYFLKTLGRPPIQEKMFPLVLAYNYTGVIRPRCELLKTRVKHFEFEEVFPLTDEQFCSKYDISMEELERKKAERQVRDEKDILWAYVPGL